MVRLVFRPYTRVGRAICTSAPLRASTRVSSGFALLRHSSPSFGSQHTCSRSDLHSENVCRLKLIVLQKSSLSLRPGVLTPFDSQACQTPWSVFQDGSNRVVTLSSSDAFAEPSAPDDPKKVFRSPRSPRQIDLYVSTPVRAEHIDASHCDAVRFPYRGFRFLSLSFQSAFQLSLTVLVCCRSPTSIQPSMRFTTDQGSILKLPDSTETDLYENAGVQDGRDFHPPRQTFPCHFPERTPPVCSNTTPVRDFHIGLLPLRSPLLGESWLVYFPPLNYMLKFSGLPCLI